MKINVRMLAALLLATVGPAVAIETGPADFRITEVGPPTDPDFDAFNPSLAYNSVDEEYLIVWSGDGESGGLGPQEDEIYGQRIDATTGQRVGPSGFRISRMGPDGNIDFQALDPDVAYNPTANEYLVVWWGDDDAGDLVEDEDEIYGQRVSATGALVGNQFRISFMGTDGDVLAEGKDPAVVYNATDQEYFVIWQGDHINGVFVNQEFEIWGRRVAAATGNLLGTQTRLSDMGSMDGDPSFSAADCALTYNPTANEYLVVWEADDDEGTAVDGDVEIFGQRVIASTGAEVGPNDVRISFLGPVGDTGYDSTNPAVVYNFTANEYLVAWNGSDDQNGSIRNDMEIFIQRLAPDASLVGGASRISAMGPDGVTTYWGLNPDVELSPLDDAYLLVWRGESNLGDLVNNEYEIYARALDSMGAPTTGQRRISQMGPDGTSAFNAGLPRLAHDPARNRFLAIWNGEDDRPGLVDNESEVFGQFLDLDVVFAEGFE